jgi:hypothetical protein
MLKSSLWSAALVLLATVTTQAQLTQIDRAQQVQLNTITTAVPFLGIAPDSRSGALGDAGVALSPDANLTHWNPAKLSFVDNDLEVSMSYSPWLRALVPDMSLGYLSGYKKINKRQSVGGSLRYFTLGNITFTDINGSTTREFKPAEFAVDMSFGQRLSENLGGGIAARYVNSNLTGGSNVEGASSKAGQAVAVDVSVFYSNDKIKLAGKKARINWGAAVTNIGNKMRYTNTARRDFIPTNLRLGYALTMNMDEHNSLTLTTDFNKLLVPTPPKYKNNSDTIVSGMDPNVGTAQGIVQSFYDAPGQIDQVTGEVIAGSKFKEELREINIGGGLEYWYDNQFAVRTGYFYENITKGNRQFITLGAGLKYDVLTIDISYLISTTQQNPLANTLRFSLRFGINKKDRKSEEGAAGGEE